jgi:hypothetical protein
MDITALGLLIVVAWLSYIAGRIGPDPLGPWETKLRRRSFEWRVWWIDEQMRRAQARRDALVDWHEEAGS